MKRIRSLLRNRLVGGALVAGAVILGWRWFIHHGYVEDVREICNAEAKTETTIASQRVLVEAAAEARLKSGPGVELLKTMRSVAPEVAAKQLRSAAASAGTPDCPSVAGYEKLAARVKLSSEADRLCRHLDPITVAKVPRAKRTAFVAQWARDNIREDDLDAMLAPIEPMPLDEAVPQLKKALSAVDVHACNMLPGLSSPVSPVSGPNMIIQSVGVPNDAREAAMKELFQQKAGDFVACYERGLAKDKSLAGTISVKFQLTDRGVIDFALAQDDSTLHSAEATACATALVKTVRGPAGKSTSPGGLIVEFWVAP